MRKLPLVLSALAGGAVVALVLVIGNLVDIKIEIRRAPTGSAQKPAANASPVPQLRGPAVGQDFVASSGEPRRLVESASKLTSAGQLREAQERYLQVLLVNPDDQEAMRGLVRVRRLMARNDARILRRQAAAYRRALTQGKETGEHYTASAMDLLAMASQQAAAELEDSSINTAKAAPPDRPRNAGQIGPQVRTSSATQPPPRRRTRERPAATVSKAPKPPPKVTKRKAPQLRQQQTPDRPEPTLGRKREEVDPRNTAQLKVRTPTTVTSRPERRPPPPPLLTAEPDGSVDMEEPFLTIIVGPISSGSQASDITTELTVAGYVARMRRGGANYFISLGPYRKSVAERIVSRIRARFSGVSVGLTPFSD